MGVYATLMKEPLYQWIITVICANDMYLLSTHEKFLQLRLDMLYIMYKSAQAPAYANICSIIHFYSPYVFSYYLFFPFLPFFPPMAAPPPKPFFFPCPIPNAAFCLKYILTTFSTLPLSCFSFLMYVNRARLALFAARWTTSIPSTSGEYILYHISTPTLVSWPRSRIAVSTPRRRIFMQTPANGSPVRWRTSRISPTRAHSGFVFEKRRVRAPVGSSSAICEVFTCETGSEQIFWTAGLGA